MFEIEKKYLLNVSNMDEIIDLLKNSSTVNQTYISLEPEIRIRKRADKYYITKKSVGTQKREEIETQINATTYEILKSKAIGNTIIKERTDISLGDGLTAEVDIYKGDFSGLCIVEVEFKSEEQAANFIPPRWFGKEITDDMRYKNRNLSQLENPKTLVEESSIR